MYGHVITKFSRMGRLLHFLTHGAPLARFARESSAIMSSKNCHSLLAHYELTITFAVLFTVIDTQLFRFFCRVIPTNVNMKM